MIENKVSAISLIAEERVAQIERGFTSEHDEQHQSQQLLVAATALCLKALNEADSYQIGVDYFLDEYCPVDDFQWVEYIVDHERPNKIKGLVIAGALIAAEIDRLQRATT